MSANGISTLVSKQLKQESKLNIAEAKRQGKIVAINGTISGSANSSQPWYRTLNNLDMDGLPTIYVGNAIVDNDNVEGLLEGRPWVTAVAYGQKLYRYTYTGYHGNDPAWFDSQTPTASLADDTLTVNPVSTTTSYQWLGYFKPTTTETYTFYTTSDDGSALWIGDNAVSGYTYANAIVDNSGEHAAQERSGTVALTAGVYYPIRIQTGNNGGPGSHSTAFSTPTITKTTVFTNLVFHDDDTLGI